MLPVKGSIASASVIAVVGGTTKDDGTAEEGTITYRGNPKTDILHDTRKQPRRNARLVLSEAGPLCLLLDPGGDGCADLHGAAYRAEPVM
jgi:hypothetical protein